MYNFVIYILKIEFTGLRALIPQPPPDIPLELLESREPSCSSSGDDNYPSGMIEVPEQVSAKELRKKFDPNPDKARVLFSEIKKGLNLKKVSLYFVFIRLIIPLCYSIVSALVIQLKPGFFTPHLHEKLSKKPDFNCSRLQEL